MKKKKEMISLNPTFFKLKEGGNISEIFEIIKNTDSIKGGVCTTDCNCKMMDPCPRDGYSCGAEQGCTWNTCFMY